jgi:hypothetical protein
MIFLECLCVSPKALAPNESVGGLSAAVLLRGQPPHSTEAVQLTPQHSCAIRHNSLLHGAGPAEQHHVLNPCVVARAKAKPRVDDAGAISRSRTIQTKSCSPASWRTKEWSTRRMVVFSATNKLRDPQRLRAIPSLDNLPSLAGRFSLRLCLRRHVTVLFPSLLWSPSKCSRSSGITTSFWFRRQKEVPTLTFTEPLRCKMSPLEWYHFGLHACLSGIKTPQRLFERRCELS